jgi:hypothetical protein
MWAFLVLFRVDPIVGRVSLTRCNFAESSQFLLVLSSKRWCFVEVEWVSEFEAQIHNLPWGWTFIMVHHVCVSFFIIIIIILCNFALRFTCEFMFLIVCSEGLSSSRSFLQWTNTNELGMHWTSSVCTHGWFLFSAYWFIGFLITDAVGHKLWKGNHKPSMSHI